MKIPIINKTEHCSGSGFQDSPKWSLQKSLAGVAQGTAEFWDEIFIANEACMLDEISIPHPPNWRMMPRRIAFLEYVEAKPERTGAGQSASRNRPDP